HYISRGLPIAFAAGVPALKFVAGKRHHVRPPAASRVVGFGGENGAAEEEWNEMAKLHPAKGSTRPGARTCTPAYSFRRATTGSTRDARRAGTKQAKAATASSIRDTTVAVGR